MRIRIAAMLALSLMLSSAAALADAAAQSDDQVRATLTDLETKSWAAWKARDGSYFQNFTTADHLDIGPRGSIGQADVVAGVSSHACVVASYSLEPMKFTRVAPDTAMLLYRATQDTKCGGHPIPTPTWITSLYTYRGGRWLNVLFEDMPAQK
jgi:hypothetical protein